MKDPKTGREMNNARRRRAVRDHRKETAIAQQSTQAQAARRLRDQMERNVIGANAQRIKDGQDLPKRPPRRIRRRPLQEAYRKAQR